MNGSEGHVPSEGDPVKGALPDFQNDDLAVEGDDLRVEDEASEGEDKHSSAAETNPEAFEADQQQLKGQYDRLVAEGVDPAEARKMVLGQSTDSESESKAA